MLDYKQITGSKQVHRSNYGRVINLQDILVAYSMGVNAETDFCGVSFVGS